MYLLVTAAEFAASRFASRADLGSLQRAIFLSPANADYRHRLGRYYSFVASNPDAAIQAFREAARLDPYSARNWFDLAAAYQITGNTGAQRDALEHALHAEPTAPDVAWEAANFFLVQGDTDRALQEFRVVIENDSVLPGMALASCWRARPDVDALLRDVVPPRADSLLAFLDLLMSRQQTESAITVWHHLTQLHQKFEAARLLEFTRYLFLVRRPVAALQAWEQAAPVLGYGGYIPSSENLVVNGDFSLDVLNGGLDWSYVNRSGVKLLLDPTDYYQGHRSLSIAFEGQGINDAGIQQLIPVQGNTAYEFSAYYKAADFEGAGGPQISLRDAYTNEPLFTGEPMRDSDVWKLVHGEFTTPPYTALLLLNIERVPLGSPIRGKLWVDAFQLALAAEPESTQGRP
jgi:tetratricopeptide (TPR) repeat protein